jgi:hypothetical protein
MLSSQLLEVGNGLGRVAASVAVHPKHPVVEAGFDEGRGDCLRALSAREGSCACAGRTGTGSPLWPGRAMAPAWPSVQRRAPSRFSTSLKASLPDGVSSTPRYRHDQ